MTDVHVHRFTGRDGLELVYRETGDGRPLVLLHGFTGSYRHWLEDGPAAATFAQRGRRVILPDFRGHGESAQPRDPGSYPPDVLVDDALALIDQLGLKDHEYDLGGYSLGGRVVIRMLVRGARPARAIVGGQGLADVTRVGGGANHRVLTALLQGDRIEPGSPDAESADWFQQVGLDPQVLLYVLESLVGTPADALSAIETPTLVMVGDQDPDHTTGEALAAALPNGRFTGVPGNHQTALAGPELAEAICAFLTEPPA